MGNKDTGRYRDVNMGDSMEDTKVILDTNNIPYIIVNNKVWVKTCNFKAIVALKDLSLVSDNFAETLKALLDDSIRNK